MSDASQSPKEPFQDIMKSLNHFFQEKPLKGFIQNMDDVVTSNFPFSSLQVELTEHPDHYKIISNMPGTKKNHIDIETFQQALLITIKNHAEEVNTEQENNFFKKQKKETVVRYIPFAKPIEQSQVTASYVDGVLSVTVPKQKGKKLKID